MKVFIITFGCKVNQYESQVMLEELQKHNYLKTDCVSEADVIIVNSCTVTAESDKKIRQTIHKLKRQNPNAIFILTGCMSQVFPNQAEKISGVNIILGNTNRKNIFIYISEFINNKQKIIDIKEHDKNEKFENTTINKFEDHTRAFLKIEDGCNRFCSYCIIPYARGRVRSKNINIILKETKNLAKNNYKEIVLVGINLSAYGTDLNLNLCDAIEAVCSVDGIERVRLGSLEPEYLNETVINRLSKIEKLCPQFHLSLQSGCDKTLAHMNRHYTAEEYFNIVKNLRKYFNNVSITTDIMVGFAGETNEEFEESVNFVNKVKFSKIHVFTYSKRNGTKAALFDNQVEETEKKLRSKIMLNTARNLRLNFLNSQIGKIEEVLFERKDKDGLFEGYTKNYTPVKLDKIIDKNLNSKIIKIEIVGTKDDYCVGKLVENI